MEKLTKNRILLEVLKKLIKFVWICQKPPETYAVSPYTIYGKCDSGGSFDSEKELSDRVGALGKFRYELKKVWRFIASKISKDGPL